MAKGKEVKSAKYIFILLVISTIFFIPPLVNPKILSNKDNDLGRTYVPLFSFFKKTAIEQKQIPLWRPDQMLGETFIGSPMSSLVYPANILFIVFPINLGSSIYFFIHFFFAGLFTYLLAKSFRLSNLSSFAAAIFYGFSTKMLLHLSAGHLTMIAAFSLFPLSFLGFRKFLDNPKDKSIYKWVLVTATSLAFTYIAYPTVFYYSALFISIYYIYFILNKGSLKKILSNFQYKNIYIIAFTFLITGGLLSIYLLPQIEFATFSTRSQLKIEDVALPLWNFKRFLVSIFLPYLNFNDLDHESFLYLGLVPLVFSVIGFLKLKIKQKIILLLFLAVATMFAAGLSTPVFKIAYDYVPFLKFNRITTRIWFVIALLISLLAAYGLENIKNKKLIYFVIGLFIIESFFIGYRKIAETPNLSFEDNKIYQFLASDKDFFRVYCTTYCFNPQLISKYNIQVLHGETPIQHSTYVNFLQNAGNFKFSNFAVIFPPYQIWQVQNPPDPSAKLLGNANVKYIASTYPIKDELFTPIDDFGEIKLYENRLFKPRAYFESSDETVEIEKYSPNHIILKFKKSDSIKTLIISDLFYKGWKSFAQNKEIMVSDKDRTFRMISVPANTDKIELKYQPKSLILGKTITFASITFLVLLYLKKRKNE